VGADGAECAGHGPNERCLIVVDDGDGGGDDITTRTAFVTPHATPDPKFHLSETCAGVQAERTVLGEAVEYDPCLNCVPADVLEALGLDTMAVCARLGRGSA